MNRPTNPLADPDVRRQILNLLPIDRDDDPDGETLPLPTDNHRPNHADKPDDALDYEFAVGDAVSFAVRRKGEPDETLTGTITGEGKRSSGATYAVVEVEGMPHPVRVPIGDLRPAKDKARKRRPVANAVYRGADPLRLPG